MKPSLLSLPSELRLNIYRHLLPTICDDKDTIYNMRLINRQIREEYDHEALNIVTEHFKTEDPIITVDLRSWFPGGKIWQREFFAAWLLRFLRVLEG